MTDRRHAACVVYAHRHAPTELFDALIARRVDVRHETDPYAVLAGLAEATASRDRESAETGAEAIPLVVVLVEPDRLAMVRDLARIIDAAFPTCVLWQHVEREDQPLRAVTDADRATWAASGGFLPQNTPEHGDFPARSAPERPLGEFSDRRELPPTLRLVAEPKPDRNIDAFASDTSPVGPEPLGPDLSDDELQALLGPALRGPADPGSSSEDPGQREPSIRP